MAYINFNKITPPAPSDPNVDEAVQLNANWDTLDSKMTPYISGGAISDVEVGQEIFNGAFRFGVWDGTTVRVPDDIDAGWSAWTALPILAPRAIRSGFTPRWRNNSAYRMVELSGGVTFDGASSAWTLGSSFQINQLAAGSPSNSLAPINSFHKAVCATALPTAPALVASGLVTVDVSGSFTRIAVQYLGGPGGGNFVMLDQVWWWY